MAKILEMPKLSPTMEEGVLSAWHKKEGDAVEIDDLLAEVETDKATMEFRAFDKGSLLKLLVAPGTQVRLGQPVAILGKAGEDVSALVQQVGGAAPKATAPPAGNGAVREAAGAGPADATSGRRAGGDGEARAKPAETADAPKQDARGETIPPDAQRRPSTAGAKDEPAPTQASSPGSKSMLDRTERDAPASGANAGAGGGGRVLASPYVRKVARDRGIDLAGAHGTGPGGRVVAKDLESFANGHAEAKAPPGSTAAMARSPGPNTLPAPANAPGLAARGLAEPESRPLSPMRKTIARRLSESKREVPHFYLTVDVDAARLVALREQINRELEEASPKASEGEKPLKVSVNDLLVKACAVALTRVPECNAQYTPEAILVHRRVDVSVAVAVPDGLVTPVLRNADQKSVVAIAREVRELAARARAKKLRLEEMTDGTFSISNLGMFGIDSFSAVINPPEGAILAVGQVRDEPVVRDGAVVPGKRLAMTLSCDHRVIDGAIGAAFLAELRALLEHPMRVLTG